MIDRRCILNNEEALGKLTEKVLKVCKEQFKVLEKYVDSLEDFHLPTYESLKNPVFFIEINSMYTQLSSNNHMFKTKLSKSVIDITTIINEISKYKLTSVSQSYFNELKKAKDKIALYKDVLDEHQKNLDQILKHLQLCSYTMSSPYVE